MTSIGSTTASHNKTLTDLPPELLGHVATYLPTGSSISNLGRSCKSLRTFIEKDAWATFNRTRFPSSCPPHAVFHKDAARTLTALSKAWDRRAFLARYVAPQRDVATWPGGTRVERWKRPRGQTIGFAPRLDVYEEVGQTWLDRIETLAFSAGAEVCVRQRPRYAENNREDVRWVTYRPFSAHEGLDDITTLHLLRPGAGSAADGAASVRLITGTANGDLQLLTLPPEGNEVPKTYFTTQGQSVRSSSLLQLDYEPTLLAAEMGDSSIRLYEVDGNLPKIAPSSRLNIKAPTVMDGHAQQVKGHRAWSTCFLGSSNLAVGLGPSIEPLHIYPLTSAGLSKEAVRKFSLQDTADLERLDEVNPGGGGVAEKPMSSVYPIIPLPPSHTAAGSQDGQVFLSGAYDGIVRLHDLRSDMDVERHYADPTDDSAIYSLLSHGRERLVAGTSRHSLLKVFDLRLGAKIYSYHDATSAIETLSQSADPHKAAQARDVSPIPGPELKDWNLFLRPQSASYSGRGGGNNWARRSMESSIYSLASPSPTNPYIYAGVENAVVELAFTGVLDKHPDRTYFEPWNPSRPSAPQAHGHGGSHHKGGEVGWNGWRSKEVLDLVCYDQRTEMRLCTQRSLWETWRSRYDLGRNGVAGLDERWRVGTS